MSRIAGIALIGLGAACWPGNSAFQPLNRNADLQHIGDALPHRHRRSRWKCRAAVVARGCRPCDPDRSFSGRVVEASMIIAQADISFVTESQLAWSGDWAWGLPLILMTVIIHVLGLGLIGRGISRVSTGKLRTPLSRSYVRGSHGCHNSVGHQPACDRGRHLGILLPACRCSAGFTDCDAVFAKRDDKLRTRESISEGLLEAHGSDGGAKRMAAVRAEHRFSV